MEKLQCTLGHTHPPQSSAGLLIFRQTPTGRVEVFLARRSTMVSHPGSYGLPGGVRLPGETALAGALRVAQADLWIRPQAVDMRHMHTLSHPLTEGGVWTYTTFLAQPSGVQQLGPDTLMLGPEVADVDWFPTNALPGPLHPEFQASLPELLGLVDEIVAGAKQLYRSGQEWVTEDPELGEFFKQWSMQEPPPSTKEGGYFKMLAKFVDWKNGHSSVNTGSAPPQPNTPTGFGTPGKPVPPPLGPVTPPSGSGMSTSPPLPSHEVSEQLSSLSLKFKQLTNRLQGPPWPNEILELQRLGVELGKIQQDSKRINW